MTLIAAVVLVVLLAKAAMKLWLEKLNRGYALERAADIPNAFRDYMDEATYRKSVEYTAAKSRFYQIEIIFGALVLGILLFSGLLPRAYSSFVAHFGNSAGAAAAFLFGVGLVTALLELPLDWYRQFYLEQGFGFNTTTPKLWWADRLKGLLLAIAIGYPLLVLILKFVEWTGQWWWLWAWGAVLLFQLLMTMLAPAVILPLFNKFTPLPEGALRERLTALARRTGFKAKDIQVMDGSKRSLHSNAFFIGFGRFRRIVLFDTLLGQLAEPELEAVLAHEIGHYKKKHIPRMLAFSALTTLAGLYAVAWLANREWFFRAFGFQVSEVAAALLLVGLAGGVVTFWFSPLLHWWSRRYEYQADNFAAHATGQTESLINALRKLSKKNLSNLTPHPLYSRFYYSHPTLLEREAALQQQL